MVIKLVKATATFQVVSLSGSVVVVTKLKNLIFSFRGAWGYLGTTGGTPQRVFRLRTSFQNRCRSYRGWRIECTNFHDMKNSNSN